MYNLNIKELRKKKGWSQDTLAKKLGVSRQTIVNYEKGEVIPESKKELLYNILQDATENIVQESSIDYQILPGYISFISIFIYDLFTIHQTKKQLESCFNDK